MMNALRLLIVLASASMLAACGGSSSGGFDSGGQASIAVTAERDSVEANPQGLSPDPDSARTVQISARFTQADGSVVADGTPVTLSSSSSSRGVVSPIDEPTDTGSSATADTSGGIARFWFTSASQTGTVTLTASGTPPAGGATVSSSTQITVEPSSGETGRIQFTGQSTMPSNPQGVPIFMGSPFINEVTVRYIGPDGQPGQVQDGEVAVAISPVGVAAFSTLDDPDTEENEFFILVGSGPVNMTAGVTTLFIHSFDQPGTATINVTAVDNNTDEQFSGSFDIEVVDDAADFLPAQLDFSVGPEPVYIQGSGGTTVKQAQIQVRDSGGNLIPDPEGDGNAWNNVRLELDAPAGSGARLTGTGTGGSVTGSEIDVRTVNGIANFSLNAGSEIGPHRVTATVDRADNNIDTELVDPISAETTIEVGDGRLFSLELVSPIISAIQVNSAATGIETDEEPQVDPETGVTIPPSPDGTYSLRVTAQGSDQAGNPVLPGTQVNFGKIDAPLTQDLAGLFVFSGADGNPEEAGTLFSALDPLARFINDPNQPNEAVEPGDTLAMFGKSVPGNREHEAVRTVESVIDGETLTVTQPFNPNDGTGSIVDDGFVIPWVIGRSQVGTIDSAVNLGEQGRASVQLTYPINAIGRPMVLWSQGNRVESDRTKTVADVESIVFPGVAPLQLQANPGVVQANSPTTVELCLTDGIGSPVQGSFVQGAITDGPGNGQLDGEAMPTTTAQPTGSAGGGCVLTELNVSGMTPDGDESTVTFNVGAASAEVTVVPPGAARLVVEPSSFADTVLGTFTRTINLTLLDGSNNPISGANIVGECEAGEGILEIQSNPGVTDADGETTASVLVGLAACGGGQSGAPGEGFPRLGTCTFTTDSGSPEGRLLVRGIDVESLGTSPSPVCPDDNGDNGNGG